MNKSYLTQGFKATRKTYKKKKSNLITYIFLTIVSFFGKLLILPKPLFNMFDINLAKNAALYNEVNIVEGFRGVDEKGAIWKIHIVNFIRILFLLALGVMLAALVGILYFIGTVLGTVSSLSLINIAALIPVLIIGVVVTCVILSLFVPVKYITLNIKEKNLFNILYCSKASLSASLVLKVFFYNLLYVVINCVLPVVLFMIYVVFGGNLLSLVIIVFGLFFAIYVYANARMTRDTAIYLLMKNNVILEPKKERKEELEVTDEEKLTSIFTNA